jgi:hypothetical protein
MPLKPSCAIRVAERNGEHPVALAAVRLMLLTGFRISKAQGPKRDWLHAGQGYGWDVVVEGESGLLAISSPWCRPLYEPSKRRLSWPNGAIATLYSAEEADRLRGPQHDLAWGDELAAWGDPSAWGQLMFGLRLGRKPRCVVTTSPPPGQDHPRSHCARRAGRGDHARHVIREQGQSGASLLRGDRPPISGHAPRSAGA